MRRKTTQKDELRNEYAVISGDRKDHEPLEEKPSSMNQQNQHLARVAKIRRELGNLANWRYGYSRLRSGGGRKLGLRLFGSSPSKERLERDLRWWTPEGAPELLEIPNLKTYYKDHGIFPRRVVGLATEGNENKEASEETENGVNRGSFTACRINEGEPAYNTFQDGEKFEVDRCKQGLA